MQTNQCIEMLPSSLQAFLLPLQAFIVALNVQECTVPFCRVDKLTRLDYVHENKYTTQQWQRSDDEKSSK